MADLLTLDWRQFRPSEENDQFQWPQVQRPQGKGREFRQLERSVLSVVEGIAKCAICSRLVWLEI